jgi:hydroxylamine reductase (hybrid-cluster protein)
MDHTAIKRFRIQFISSSIKPDNMKNFILFVVFATIGSVAFGQQASAGKSEEMKAVTKEKQAAKKEEQAKRKDAREEQKAEWKAKKQELKTEKQETKARVKEEKKIVKETRKAEKKAIKEQRKAQRPKENFGKKTRTSDPKHHGKTKPRTGKAK